MYILGGQKPTKLPENYTNCNSYHDVLSIAGVYCLPNNKGLFFAICLHQTLKTSVILSRKNTNSNPHHT